jgi:hypothetical protein
MKLVIMQFSASCCHFPPPKPEYYPYQPVVRDCSSLDTLCFGPHIQSIVLVVLQLLW